MSDFALDDVDYEALTTEHPERARWKWKWPDYRLSYRGGHEFLLAAGEVTRSRDGTPDPIPVILAPVAQQTPRRRFLRQLDGEPNEVYNSFWDRAWYLNYLGGANDYFRHYLFSQPPTIQPTQGTAPGWWADFFGDANGAGKSFVEFVRDVFLDVQIERYAGWLFGGNRSVASAADPNDRVTLTAYKADEIIDWQRDSSGELEWIVLRKHETRRDFPDKRKVYQEITYVDRDVWQTWEVTERGAGKFDMEVIASDVHGLGEVPFEFLEIPHGLWITDKLFSWQVDLFNKMCRLGNAQLLGCIVQPFIKSNHANAGARIFGEGVLLELKSGNSAVGEEGEDMGWKSPDIAPLQFISDSIDRERDEGFRIIHQVAMAVDASASRLAQSGASKQEDRKKEEIILCGLGSYVRPAMLRTANRLAKIYGDNTQFTVDGYDNFQVSSLEDELQTASLVSAFGFWSKTAEGELHKRIEAGRINDHLDEKTKQKIRQEIDDRAEADLEAETMSTLTGDMPEDAADDSAEQPVGVTAPEAMAPATPRGAPRE